MISRIYLSLPNAYKLMYFDRNINGNRDVKFLIGIIGHCTDQRTLLYLPTYFFLKTLVVERGKSKIFRCDNYSYTSILHILSAEIIQGRKLFKGGNY